MTSPANAPLIRVHFQVNSILQCVHSFVADTARQHVRLNNGDNDAVLQFESIGSHLESIRKGHRCHRRVSVAHSARLDSHQLVHDRMHLLGHHRKSILHIAHLNAEHRFSVHAKNLLENIEEFKAP